MFRLPKDADRVLSCLEVQTHYSSVPTRDTRNRNLRRRKLRPAPARPQLHELLAGVGPFRPLDTSDYAARAAAAAARRTSRNDESWSSDAEPCAIDQETLVFKSTSVSCELAFREAKASAIVASNHAEQRPPHASLVVTCCAILGDLARACGPLRRLITELKEEFQRGIFSDYYYPAAGATTLCQIPYFEVAQRLEEERTELEGERDALKKKQAADKKLIVSLASEIRSLKSSLEDQKNERHDLNQAHSTLVKEAEATKKHLSRVKEDLDEATRENAALTVARQDAESSSQHAIYIYKTQIESQHDQLGKALAELGQAKHELQAVSKEKAGLLEELANFKVRLSSVGHLDEDSRHRMEGKVTDNAAASAESTVVDGEDGSGKFSLEAPGFDDLQKQDA